MGKESDDPGNLNDKGTWFRDPLADGLMQLHRVDQRGFSGRTAFQSVDIITTGAFGKTLVLDNRIQSSLADEFVYHESLVQPPMLCHPEPKDVLISGGGEGATAWHVLLHPSVRSVVMVDIDGEVVRLCSENMQEWHRGAFDDPRLKVVAGDARQYIEKSRKKFDVILLDIPEALEAGPAWKLYTREFYSAVLSSLHPGGIVSLQSDNASWVLTYAFPVIVNTLKSVFHVVRPYQSHIPSFGGSWGFTTASQTIDPLTLAPGEIDRRIAARKISVLRFYDGLTHRHMFSLPKHLRQRLAEEKRIITDTAPLQI